MILLEEEIPNAFAISTKNGKHFETATIPIHQAVI